MQIFCVGLGLGEFFGGVFLSGSVLFCFLTLLIYFQAKKTIQARKTPKRRVNSE